MAEEGGLTCSRRPTLLARRTPLATLHTASLSLDITH